MGKGNRMILSGLEIKQQIKQGSIVIDPFNPEQLNPNSYNIKLGKNLIVYDESVLDMKKSNTWHKEVIPEDGLVLNPDRLYLGETEEFTETNGFVPMLEGRSSIGRLGLYIHVTAGFGDNGFKGKWTLELHCVEPIRIYAGVEIGQIFYHTVKGDQALTYEKGKYQGNHGVQASKLYEDWRR